MKKKKRIYFFGVNRQAWIAYEKCKEQYEVCGFCDNDYYKQGNIFCGNKIYSLEYLIKQKENGELFGIVIIPKNYISVVDLLESYNLDICGIWDGESKTIEPYHYVTFEEAIKRDFVYFYAGTVYDEIFMNNENLFGISIDHKDKKNILHDITKPYPIEDNCVDVYQAEDVLEHIEYEKLRDCIDEIYRILKPGGLLRISLPDYRQQNHIFRSITNENGEILYDTGGGGKYINGKVEDGGHVWFPTYEKMKTLLEKTKFHNIHFLHYFDEEGKGILNKIDYNKGYIARTPDHIKLDIREPISIVVDCLK